MFSSWPVAHSHSMFTILLLLVWSGHLQNVAVLSPLSPNMGRISICGALVQVVKRFGATNGCSVVPNSWLNEEVRLVMMMFMLASKRGWLNEKVMMMRKFWWSWWLVWGRRSNFLSSSLKLSTRRASYMTCAIPQLGQIALFVTGGWLCLDVGM